VKKVAFALVIVALLAATGAVSAQSNLNGTGWWSAIQVQRVGTRSGSAVVQMTGYPQQGTATAGTSYDCGSRTLAAFGSAALFYPHWSGDPAGNNCADDADLPANWQGAGVLSSDDEMVAIVQALNISFGGWAPGDSPYGRAVGAYTGVGTPDTEVKFPVYKNNHQGEMTTFFVQNAGGDPATITAVFKPCADNGQGTPCLGYPNVYTYTTSTAVPSNEMLVLDASMASVPAGTNSMGGLTITSGQPIAAVVYEHSQSASPATYVKTTRGFTPSDYDTQVYAPAIKYQYPDGTAATSPNKAKWSGLVVHNADTVNVSGVVTYTLTQRNADPGHADVGTKYTQTFANLSPGESVFFLFHAGLNPATGTQPRDMLAAEVSASGNIVAIINEEADYGLSGDKDYATYSAIPRSMASTRVSFPTHKEQHNGKFHGAVVQNVGTASTYYTATLTVVEATGGATIAAGSTVKIRTKSAVPVGGTTTYYLTCEDYDSLFMDLTGDTNNMADLCVGSPPTGGVNTAMIIEASQPIVGFTNEELLWYVSASSAGDGYGEDASNYEAFPLD
jgi:hypothetical protein